MHERDDPQIRTQNGPDAFPVRLGIIGGGQLARMTALAAMPLGCDVVVLERNPFSPAARLSPGSMVGDWNDPATLLEFAAGVDVVTLENEFVDAAVLKVLEDAGHRLFPCAASIALVQDKLIQKQTLQQAGLPVAAFRAVDSMQEIGTVADQLGWPMLLKTRRDGYDGKGNFTLRSQADVETGWQKLGGGLRRLLGEAFWNFSKELAVIVTRGRDGSTAVYPVVETEQRDHVCHVVRAPARIPPAIAAQASDLARRAVEAVGGLGSFGVEMFLSASGELAINELAPRVHNSGHYTIEACECSQFENHVRAVLGWPLGSTRMVAPAALMRNLLGEDTVPGQPRGWAAALRVPGAHVHLYGKVMSSPGRKMGHVTALGASVDEAAAVAERAANEIRFGAR